MSATTNKNYKISFILDLRSSEDDAAKVLADINEVIDTVGGKTSSSEDLGMREFVRAADQRYKQGHYLEVYVDGPSTVPADLKEKLKLDKRVNRIFVEA
jgi:ribosomal protein S6